MTKFEMLQDTLYRKDIIIEENTKANLIEYFTIMGFPEELEELEVYLTIVNYEPEDKYFFYNIRRGEFFTFNDLAEVECFA